MSVSPMRRIRLPARFYPPAADPHPSPRPTGLPWREAVEYMTDGQRFGMRARNGPVRWLSEVPEVQLERFREDFQGVDIGALLEGLRAYARRHPQLKFLWKDDLGALEDLLADEDESLRPSG